jgi:hypothetical protein
MTLSPLSSEGGGVSNVTTRHLLPVRTSIPSSAATTATVWRSSGTGSADTTVPSKGFLRLEDVGPHVSACWKSDGIERV